MNNDTTGASTGTAGGTTGDDAEDPKLVDATLAGDAQAFEKLFVKYRQRVFAVSWRLLREEQSALDVVQDAFVKAYEELEKLRGESRFYPWLRKIAVNMSIDRLRQMRRSREVSLFTHNDEDGEGREELVGAAAYASVEQRENNPGQQAEVGEFSSALSAALLKLSDSHRAVFMLHAAEGMSYKEIAEALGCNIGTVMSRLFYARKRLQELLGAHLRTE
jgi:RNA polymerase sigma-70 factor (ECF subfamily)